MKLIRSIFFLIVLIQPSCAFNGRPIPEWAQYHSEDYPCPQGTLKIGDPRFPDHWICQEWWIGEGIQPRVR